MSAQAQELAQRRQLLLDRLAAHRLQIERTLSPPPQGREFPRSQILRLLLSEPLMTAAISAVGARLLGGRMRALLPAAFAVAGAWWRRAPGRDRGESSRAR